MGTLWRGLAAVTLGALALGAACTDNSRPAATINDPAFVRGANAVCRSTVPKLRAPDRKATSTTVLRADNLDATADGLAAVATRLKTVPVRAQDAARVQAWLADWDRFVVVGHRYAAAVRRDDEQGYTRIDDEAVRLALRIGTFARGNRIDSCIL